MTDPTPETDAAHAVESLPEPETFLGHPVTYSRGQRVLHVERSQIVILLQQLFDDGYHALLDVCGVDYLVHPGRTELPDGVTGERFEVVYQLLNHTTGDRLRLRVQVPEDEPVVASVYDLHPGAEAMEREAFDMYGIVFTDHPDLTRILLPEDWVGHPLRKDFSVGRVPVQFKGAPSAR